MPSRTGIRGHLSRRLGWHLGRRLRGASLEALGDRRDGRVDVHVALAAGGLDGRQQRTDGIDHAQQGVGRRRRHVQLAVAQSAQQVLTDVGDGLEAAECQEPTGPLDGMDRSEDARQQLAGLRLLLQRHQIPVELIQVLVALHEKFLDDLVHPLHVPPPVSFAVC
jgi:hypothetical protein